MAKARQVPASRGLLVLPWRGVLRAGTQGLGEPQVASGSLCPGLTLQENADKSQQNSLGPVHGAQLLEEHSQDKKKKTNSCVSTVYGGLSCTPKCTTPK